MSDTTQSKEPFFEHYYSYYSGDLVVESRSSRSGITSLINKQANSVKFRKEDNFLRCYFACTDALLNCKKELAKRDKQKSDVEANLNKLESQLAQLLPDIDSNEKNDPQEVLNFSQLKKIETEKELERLKSTIEEKKKTIEKFSNKSEGVFDPTIYNAENIDLLRESIERDENTRGNLDSQLGGLDQQGNLVVYTPDKLKRCFDNVASDIKDTLTGLHSFMRVNLTLDLVKAIANTISTLYRYSNMEEKIPTLQKAVEEQEMASRPLCDMPNLSDHVMEILQRNGKSDANVGVVQDIKLIIRNSKRESFAFEGAARDIKYDYEFASNPYAYAYLKYLANQVEIANEKYIHGLCERARGNKFTSDEQCQNTVPSDQENIDDIQERCATSYSGSDSLIPSLPDDPDDESGGKSRTFDGDTDLSDVKIDSNSEDNSKDAATRAIDSLKENQDLDAMSEEEIAKRILTINSVEQNLLLAYLMAYFNRSDTNVINNMSKILISKGVPERYAEKYTSAIEVYKHFEAGRSFYMIWVGIAMIQLEKLSTNRFKLEITSRGEMKCSKELYLHPHPYDTIFSEISGKV